MRWLAFAVFSFYSVGSWNVRKKSVIQGAGFDTDQLASIGANVPQNNLSGRPT